MNPVVTLDGQQLHPFVDDLGVKIFNDGLTGWYGAPSPRTDYSDRPQSAGSFYGPAWQDKRVIGITGMVKGVDRADLLAKQYALAALASDPSKLYELRVDEGLSLACQVQRSDATQFKPVNDRTATYTMGFTAPDPIRYSTTIERRACEMGAHAAGGLNFGAGSDNLLSNPGFETGLAPWTATGGTAQQWSPGRTSSNNKSAKVTPDGTSAQVYLASEKVDVGTATNLLASAWAQLSEAGSYSTSVNWYDSTGTLLSTSSNVVSVAANTLWVRYENTFPVPTGATQAQLVPTVSGTPTQPFYLDDTKLTPSSGSGLDFSGGGLNFGSQFPAPIMYLTNPGTADVLPVFTLPLPVTQPVLENPDNAGRLEYLESVASGQQLVIDCRNKTVLLSGIPRRTSMGRADFEAFTVPAGGTLRVSFSSLTYVTPGAKAMAEYQHGWW